MYTIRSGNIWALDHVMQQQGLSSELRDLLMRLLMVDPVSAWWVQRKSSSTPSLLLSKAG